MNTKLHVNVKNFISNPYVVRIDHNEMSLGNPALSEFRKILTRSKKIFGDTWGYSNPEIEVIQSGNKDTLVIGNNAAAFNYPDVVYRSYWIFADNMDALQFRLAVGEKAKQVYIWPQKVKFTITEFIHDNCST